MKESSFQMRDVSVNSSLTEGSKSGRCERLNALSKSRILEKSEQSKHPVMKEHDVVRRWSAVRQTSREQPGLTSDIGLLRIQRMQPSSSMDDSAFYSRQHEEVMLTARGLCRDYICYRLKRSGFRGRVVITKYAPAKDQKLSFDILQIGKMFEELYPHLFRNLARQLGHVLRSSEELRVVFGRLAADVMGRIQDEYRWGRILALLAIAGSLSVDCIAQGHVDLIENMVTIFCDFVEANLVSWIICHGGWECMAKTFSIEEQRPRNRWSVICRGSNLLAVAISGIILSGIFFTMGAVSRPFFLRESPP